MTSTNTVGPSDEVGAYPNGSTELGLNQWTVLSYAYALLCVVGLGYFLFDSPIQVSDGFTNLTKAANGTLGSLVYSEFFQRGYLRPLLWGHTRVLFDLSSGHYFEWFRGWHVAQVALLSVLFVRLVRPRTLLAAAVVPLGLSVLVGMHTFAGAIREAFPINTFMTIVLCSFAAADLALGQPRWWRDVAAALLLVFAALTVESGLLVAVVGVAAYLAGAKGVSRYGVAAQVVLITGYFLLRFVLQIGAPGLEERSSGFGFSSLEPDELVARFGRNPTPFYAYNVLCSILSLLFSEPRGGTFVVTSALVRGELPPAGVVNVVSSVLATMMIVLFVWRRRDDWRVRRFDRADQLVIVFGAVALANAAISYGYSKDVILSPAGALFAVALTVSARHALEWIGGAPRLRVATSVALLAVLSAGWGVRSVSAHMWLRAGAATHAEWAYIDSWLERQGQVLSDPFAIDLKRRLQNDAVSRHPMRPALRDDAVWWFYEP